MFKLLLAKGQPHQIRRPEGSEGRRNQALSHSTEIPNCDRDDVFFSTRGELLLLLLLLLISLIYTSNLSAKTQDQIDLIIFSHPNMEKNTLNNFNSSLIPSAKALPLTTNAGSSYHLLPNSQSSLGNELYLLTHKSNYSVLSHYSWVQPHNNSNAVMLPKISYKGWEVQGTVRVKKENYYSLQTNLKLSPPDAPDAYFEVHQQQRIKENEVYFIDHPQIGMLVKIH